MNFLRHIKISQKLALAFSVLIGISLLMAFLAFSSINDVKQADAESDAATQMEAANEQFQASFLTQRQKLLYFLLTGDRDGLKEYEELQKQTLDLFGDLQKKANGNAVIATPIAQLGKYYQEWTGNFADKQVQLMRNYLTVNEARAIEVTGMPEALMDNFDKTAQKLSHALEVIVDQAMERRDAAMGRFTMTILVSIGISVLAALIFGYMLTRLIARPISRITDVMDTLAHGKLDIEIQGADRRDEIGAMANAVEVFKQNAVKQREQQAKEAEQQEHERLRTQRMTELAQEFDEKMTNGLQVVAQSVEDVTDSASTMAGNALETGTLSHDASSAIDQASTNIQTVSAATTQLSSSVSEISRQMAQTSDVTRAAVGEIESTNARVVSLNDAADRIGEVIKIISDIAEQTNLLALNATIEAARAGDAGKGFAVVASEVKNLANQTAKATDQIGLQIAEIQSETGAAADAVLGIGETIRKIDELTAAVASAVEEQGAATSEIARNVDEAARGTNQVANVVQSVAKAADETGKLADSQKKTVVQLGDNNNVLKSDIDDFLNTVKNL